MGVKKKVSLHATFWRFLWMLVVGIAGSVLLSYGAMMLSIGCGLATYSNHSEVQVKEMAPILAATPELSEIRLPVGVEYVLLDKTYRVLGTSLSGEEQEQAIAYASTGAVDGTARKRYVLVTRETEYVVLQYYIGSQFTNEWMKEHLPPPDVLLVVLAGINCIAISAFLTARFAKRLRRQLEPLINATAEITEQNLDFEVGHSNVKEFDEVLLAFSDMKESLKDSLERQWRAEQLQREQIAALAHDIKTPLTVIRGNTDLLSTTGISREQQSYVEYISEGTEQMQEYVRILIELSKVSAGYRLNTEEVETEAFLSGLEIKAEALCNVKQIRLCVMKEELPKKMKADVIMLERAVMNILNNALEYSLVGGTISLKVGTEGDWLKLTVEDEGEGFSQDALLHAKEQFYMADRSRSGSMHYGMGLYIATSIAEQHGGELVTENLPESQGARVSIRIPV